jgi:hypothetical protein
MFGQDITSPPVGRKQRGINKGDTVKMNYEGDEEAEWSGQKLQASTKNRKREEKKETPTTAARYGQRSGLRWRLGM